MSRKAQRNLDLQQFWRQHLERWQALSISIRQYCREQTLSEASFYSWKRELKRRQAEEPHPGGPTQCPSQAANPDFVPVVVTPVETRHAGSGVLEIELPGGVRLKVPGGFDEATLRLVLELTGGSSC